jgi:hypothetical protein
MFSDTAISWINDDKIPFFCFFGRLLSTIRTVFWMMKERCSGDARNDQEWDGMIMDPKNPLIRLI